MTKFSIVFKIAFLLLENSLNRLSKSEKGPIGFPFNFESSIVRETTFSNYAL